MLSNLNHTQISNEFIDDYLSKLSGSEVKIFLSISRKTIGWHKETDKISLSQLQNITGLGREAVNKSIKSLEIKGLIIVSRYENRTNEYEINYKVVRKSNQGSTIIEPKGSTIIEHTKETLKETNQNKEIGIPNVNQEGDTLEPQVRLGKVSIGKDRYGECENVKLTKLEYEKLIIDFGKDKIEYYINSLSLYHKINKYTDHNLTLRAWLHRDKIKKLSEEKKDIPVLLQWQVDELKDRSWRFKKPEPIEGKDYILKAAL